VLTVYVVLVGRAATVGLPVKEPAGGGLPVIPSERRIPRRYARDMDEQRAIPGTAVHADTRVAGLFTSNNGQGTATLRSDTVDLSRASTGATDVQAALSRAAAHCRWTCRVRPTFTKNHSKRTSRS